MKPNHHWSVHIPDQVVQYGPLNGFWAFLTERLNKILKNLNSNNWTGGRLEVSMMREFHRSSRITSVLNRIALETSTSANSSSPSEHELVQLILGATGNVEAIGTVQDAANAEKSQVHYGGNPTHGTEMLSPFVDFYEFALLDGKRITPTSRSRHNTAGSSIIQARYNNEAYAGEVRHLIQHRQPGISADHSTMLAHVLWMKRSNLTPLDAGKSPWDN
ncbi:hypothetical protein B0H14DRAFT_3161315 [Mycena olivaceomarginata]|nr:hypothetical protein B0H14DRAFT_3161315 [Mycena olivaceomarginata]